MLPQDINNHVNRFHSTQENVELDLVLAAYRPVLERVVVVMEVMLESSSPNCFLDGWSCQPAFAFAWITSEGFLGRATSEAGLPQRWSKRPLVVSWGFKMDLCSVLNSLRGDVGFK